MPENPEPRIRLQLEIPADQPDLLVGLEAWLRLGLLTHDQVRELCSTRLVCALPPIPQAAVDPLASGSDLSSSAPVAAPAGPRDFLPPEAAPPRRPQATPVRTTPARTSPGPTAATPRRPSLLSVWLQQLMGELSVVWLLGLGVFLVVLSSAVLAATQWSQFSAVGQYLVLFAYTTVFWGIGLWSAANARLQLTSKTLQIIALLLVPLNVWAIDGLGVGRTAVGFAVALLTIALLSLMGLQVLRRWSAPAERWVNFLGLAYLHLGWTLPWMPIAAVYAGTGSTALATLYGYQPPAAGQRATPPRLPWLLVLFSLGLILLRALATLDAPEWGQLGLALGLYGAPLVWLGQQALVESAQTPQPAAGEPAAGLPGGPPSRPLAQWGLWGGRLLLWWGWLLAVADWPAQALGISAIGLGLRLWLLGRLGRRWDLAFALVIALQFPFLLWDLLPEQLRAALFTPLAEWTQTTNDPSILLGISLFPYVALLVAAADYFYRRHNRRLSSFAEGLGLGLGSLLTIISVASTPVLVLNLAASTATALIATLRRRPLQAWRVYSTHVLALMTIGVAIAFRWPELSITGWTYVAFGLMAIDLLLSRGRANLWQESAWDLGRVLAGLAYLLLLGLLIDTDFQTRLSLLGLSIPLVLLLVQGYSASVLALGLTAPLTLGLPWTRLVGLGAATGLAAANSQFRREPGVAMLTVGFTLGWIVSLLHDGVPGWLPNNTYWYGVGAIVTLGLWLLTRYLPPSADAAGLSAIYRTACDRWGLILSGVILLGITLESGLLYSGLRPAYLPYAVALAVLMGAMVFRFWRQPQPLVIYSLGWAAELLVSEGISWRGGTLLTLSTATLGLGLLTLVLAAALQTRQVPSSSQPLPTASVRPFPSDLLAPLRNLALIYALLAIGLRTSYFTAWTGWLTLVASLIALEVGRQTRWGWLRWIALVGISLGWYELVFYQLSQATGGFPADGIVVLAGVAALIMGVYRLSAGLLDRQLGLPQVELRVAAHVHWGVGSGLMLLSAGSALISGGPAQAWLALAIGLALMIYALLQGRVPAAAGVQTAWVYLGLIELVGWIAYVRLVFRDLRWLDSWWGVVACAVAVALYWIPWDRWGWPQSPWRRMAVALPLTILFLTGALDHVPSLWITAGFYGWLAWSAKQVRISYWSVGLIVWAIWVWQWENSIADSLVLVTPCALAVLYITQVDPALQQDENREARHWFRVLALGLILGVALLSARWTGLPVGGMALGAIALGLVLRIRAFLYIGTVIFGLNAINQLVLLNATYPFMKWVLGILVGVALIWIAADFERRREQWLSLTQGWVQELDRWS